METKKSAVLSYQYSHSGGNTGSSRSSGPSNFGSKETVFQHLEVYKNQRVIVRLAGGRKSSPLLYIA